jgi:hypothetical protein
MSPPRPGPDPEQQAQQAHANELMLAVAARLLGEARLAGAFPTGAGALAPFAAAIAPELQGDEHVTVDREGWADLPRSDYKLLLGEPEPGEVDLRCHYGPHWLGGRLRIDGVFGEQHGGFGLGPGSPEQRVELSPREQEVMKLAFARRKEAGGPGGISFRGDEFRRALAVPPQPDAPAQILSVELYGDGLVVRYTYDDPVDVWSPVPLHYYGLAEVELPIESLLAEAEEEGGNLEPDVSVTDDLGTRYLYAGGGRGGVEVAHGETSFTPAVPAEASRLVISSYAGTVEVDL